MADDAEDTEPRAGDQNAQDAVPRDVSGPHGGLLAYERVETDWKRTGRTWR
jgi:hypothetical protein